MAIKQIIKRISTRDYTPVNEVLSLNNNIKENTEMRPEQLEQAEAIASQMHKNVKVVKKERGLIERTESSKIVLTEDNRQVLND